MLDELQCPDTEFYELGKELADSGLSLRCQVRGRSMFPFVRDGDVIQVAPASIDQLSVGDIIFYRSGTRLLAHRVLGLVDTKEGKFAKARGDAFFQPDPPISSDDLIGRVEFVSRLSRGHWRQISPGEGLTGLIGVLVARSQRVHRCVRWASYNWLRLANRLIGLSGTDEDCPEGGVLEVQRQKR